MVYKLRQSRTYCGNFVNLGVIKKLNDESQYLSRYFKYQAPERDANRWNDIYQPL